MGGRRAKIEIKSIEQIMLMREAGLVVARALAAMRDAASPGVSTLDLDELARGILADAGATSSFLDYHGYPAVICASVNDRVVHGIPSAADRLSDGDLISIDFGAIVEGWHGDAAITVEVGAVEPAAAALSETCRKSLWDGLAKARVGGRLTDISNAVETSVNRCGKYGIVTGYGGHGIGSQMHMDPHVLNHGRPGRGPRLEAGMALAIEPMLHVALIWPMTLRSSEDCPVVSIAPVAACAALPARAKLAPKAATIAFAKDVRANMPNPLVARPAMGHRRAT